MTTSSYNDMSLYVMYFGVGLINMRKAGRRGPARPTVLLVHGPLRPSRPKLRLLQPQRHKTVMVRWRWKL